MEYVTSWSTAREKVSPKQRTARWVKSYTTGGIELISPSVPPSILSDFSYDPPPSESDSHRSVPPRMVLRYGGGLPDIPIPRTSDTRKSSRNSSTLRTSTRTTSLTPSTSLIRSSSDRRRGQSVLQLSSSVACPPKPYSFLAPEEINVPPSQQYASTLSRTQSKSHPRSTTLFPTFEPPPFPSSHDSATTSEPHKTWHSYVREPSHHSRKRAPVISSTSSGLSSKGYRSSSVSQKLPSLTSQIDDSYSHPEPEDSRTVLGHIQPDRLPTASMSLSRNPATPIAERRRGNTWSGHKKPPPLLGHSPSTTSVNAHGTYYFLPSSGGKIRAVPASPNSTDTTATSTFKSSTQMPQPLRKSTFFRKLLSFAGKFTPANKPSAISRTNALIYVRKPSGKSSYSGSSPGGRVYGN